MESFANGLNFYKLFWIFFIGCFLGVVIEEIWCMVRYHKRESRKGLIYGPFNLLYGFGALFITLALIWLNDTRDIVVFIFGALLGGIYEYGCSVFQEKVLGSKSWDYKMLPLSLHGRVNLLYCFFWGFLTVFWIKDIYPVASDLVEKIPNNIGIPLTYACLVFIILNGFISAMAIYRMSMRLSGKAKPHKFWNFIDKKYPDERMRKVYPNMKFI